LLYIRSLQLDVGAAGVGDKATGRALLPLVCFRAFTLASKSAVDGMETATVPADIFV